MHKLLQLRGIVAKQYTQYSYIAAIRIQTLNYMYDITQKNMFGLSATDLQHESVKSGIQALLLSCKGNKSDIEKSQ